MPLPDIVKQSPWCLLAFPIDNKQYENLRDALDKLRKRSLADMDSRNLRGARFWLCEILGLHMEVAKERLEREFDLILLPQVLGGLSRTKPMALWLKFKPSDLPDVTRIDRIEEPYLKAKIIVPRNMLVRWRSWL